MKKNNIRIRLHFIPVFEMMKNSLLLPVLFLIVFCIYLIKKEVFWPLFIIFLLDFLHLIAIYIIDKILSPYLLILNSSEATLLKNKKVVCSCSIDDLKIFFNFENPGKRFLSDYQERILFSIPNSGTRCLYYSWSGRTRAFFIKRFLKKIHKTNILEETIKP